MRSLALALLLSACAEEPPPPQPEPQPEAEAPAAPEAPSPKEEPAPVHGGEDAAQVVRTYYALIEARRYAEAYKLREPAPAAPGLGAFAANFDRYAEYHATIGTPSEPVESNGWLYVEVPVQPYGRMKDGSPLASAGTLTLRRRAAGGSWRIFTKG